MIKNHNDVIYSVIQRLVKHESSTTRIHWSVYCRLRRIASTVPGQISGVCPPIRGMVRPLTMNYRAVSCGNERSVSDDLPGVVTREYFHRGPVEVSPGFPLKPCGNDGV